MSVLVTVVDYGVGNLHSVVKAIRHEGGDVRVTSSPGEVKTAERLVLPGVGAFADGMRELVRRDLVDALKTYFATERPFLGICLGMQLLLRESEEFGTHEGLGVVPGRVVKIAPTEPLKVPHIGWTGLTEPRPDAWKGSILEGSPPGTMTYFVHSFAAVPDNAEDILAVAHYGGFPVTAAVKKGNITGCQFHPEKSGPIGLAMLRKYLGGLTAAACL